MTFYFEKLIAWQKSYSLTKLVYESVEKFPKQEQYSLTNQIQRSAVSIVSNIAEGSSGKSDADHKKFLSIAHGSRLELATQIMLATDLGYIEIHQKTIILDQIEEIVKMLYSMRHKK